MPQKNLESINPDNHVSQIPDERALVTDIAAVRDALDWGLNKEAPVVEQVLEILDDKSAQRCVRRGQVLVVALPYDHQIAIRKNEQSVEIDNLERSMRKVEREVHSWHRYRHDYAGRKVSAKYEHNDKQLRNGSIFGGGTLIGAPALAEIIKMAALQADPILAAGTVALGGVVAGAGRAAHIHRKYRKSVAEVPAPAARGEELLQRLTPALEMFTDTYAARARNGDIIIREDKHVMSFDNMRELLRMSDSSERAEIDDILKHLQNKVEQEDIARVKAATQTKGGHEATSMAEKTIGKYYYYDPLELISGILADTDGTIWTDAFENEVRTVAALQTTINEEQTSIATIKKTMSKAVGVSIVDTISELEQDIAGLRETLDFTILQILGLQAQHIKGIAAGVPAVTSPASANYSPRRVAESNDHKNEWPLLGDPTEVAGKGTHIDKMA